MNARERLRRYLEQRRELGESEYVLDSLTVDSVLDLLGAGGEPLSSGAGASSRSEVPTLPRREPRVDLAGSPDWRATLTPPGAIEKRGSGVTAQQADLPRRPPGRLPEWLLELGVEPGILAGQKELAYAAAPDVATLPDLDAVARHVALCERCSLHASARNPVPGEGNPNADFLCVGEAPGASEDEQGRPFVGEAGQLLNRILAAIGLSRESVFICNVLKHRPPGNRDPLPHEVTACMPYLERQIELVSPRVILALGRSAAQTLLGSDASISSMRGRVHFYNGIPLIVTYHPAALLRNEAWKRPTWEDVQLARRVLDASLAAHGERTSSNETERS